MAIAVKALHGNRLAVEVGARVIFPIGIHWVEKITTIEGVPHLWALGDPYPISQCQYLYPNDRLSNWWGQCPKCHQNASDYLKRQRIGDKFHGGYAFCESCLTSWPLPVSGK